MIHWAGDQWEQMKRTLYRRWWPIRHEHCTLPEYRRFTHDERFAQMWGETMTEYHRRLNLTQREPG